MRDQIRETQENAFPVSQLVSKGWESIQGHLTDVPIIFQYFQCLGEPLAPPIGGPSLAPSRSEDHVDRTRSHCGRFPAKPGRLCWERNRRFNHLVGSFIRISRNAIGSAGSRRGAQLDAPTSSSDSNLNRSGLSTNSWMKWLVEPRPVEVTRP